MTPHSARGDILAATLFFLALFVVVMVIGIRLVSQQLHQLVYQEQVEQLFNVAEAGAFYTQWLLNQAGIPADQLSTSSGCQVTGCVVTDPVSGQAIGTFALEFDVTTAGSTTTVRSTSTAHNDRPVKPQVLISTWTSQAGELYQLARWDYQR